MNYQQIKRRNTGCLIVILIFLALVVAVSIYAALSMGKMGGEDAAKVSLEEYQQIQMGMTYDEVCNIIGGEGMLQYQSDSTEESYEIIYLWDGEGAFGSGATFTFRQGVLEEKQQFGLE